MAPRVGNYVVKQMYKSCLMKNKHGNYLVAVNLTFPKAHVVFEKCSKQDLWIGQRDLADHIG